MAIRAYFVSVCSEIEGITLTVWILPASFKARASSKGILWVFLEEKTGRGRPNLRLLASAFCLCPHLPYLQCSWFRIQRVGSHPFFSKPSRVLCQNHGQRCLFSAMNVDETARYKCAGTCLGGTDHSIQRTTLGRTHRPISSNLSARQYRVWFSHPLYLTVLQEV